MQLEEEECVEFLIDDAAPVAASADAEPWKLLIVDDDEEVHEATRFVLQDVRLCERPLQLIHARSAAEAAATVAQEADLAVILLDVVMESPDAGLQLIQRIRQELQRSEVRIVLRTGQPGHAPELEVIRDYDINDYKTKAELTHTRLITTLIAAIRSYEQLRAINDNRRGLELIVGAAASLMQEQTLAAFAKKALSQLATLLRRPDDGLVCAERGGPYQDSAAEAIHIVAASGRHAEFSGQGLERLRDPQIAAAIKGCVSRQQHYFGPHYCGLYLRDRSHEAALLLRTETPLSAVDRQLAEVFAANAAICFGNVKLVERLNFVAYHDPLTRLPNRASFLLDLNSAGALALPEQVVCMANIVHFTDINNALGHAFGDHLLQAIGRRLAQHFRGCRLARIGGDRFGLLGNAAQLTPEKIFEAFALPFVAGEHRLPIEINLGYCRITAREKGDTLFKRADMALTEARLDPNKRYVEFLPAMEEHTRWRLEVIRQLRRDFHANGLSVWFQPQVSLTDGGLVGVEALARWPSGDGFAQPPEIFIRLAEDAGLIVDIGTWVLDQSCATFRRLHDDGCSPGFMAVNVSMLQVRQPGFPRHVLDILERHGMPPTALELEITESLLLTEPQTVQNNLEILRREGIRIAVDDFGTGYSSLAYLRQLPIDRLKVDRSFVIEIEHGKGDLFAETILELARKLGLATIAEGVETPYQATRLRELGCDSAQGFLYAEPMPATALPEWLAGRTLH